MILYHLMECHFRFREGRCNYATGRDLDILALSKEEAKFGVSVTTLDKSLRRFIEPRSSPSAQRIELLQEATRKGFRTYAILEPLLPYLLDTEANLNPLLWVVKDVGADYFYVDQLNRRFKVSQSQKSVLRQYFSNLIEVYRKFLFDEGDRERC